MDPATVIGIAFGLALDAFAVAVGLSVSLGKVTGRQVFRLSFHFGLFQALMPLVGWLAGLTVAGCVSAWDHWVAFALLALIGGRAVIASFREAESGPPPCDPTRGITLVALAIATSLDALAAGLSFAMLEVSIWYPIAVIGAVAAGMTALGMKLGARLGERFGRRAELAGGLVLIGIGVKIVLDHTLA
jgi:putative Mn2+ efflux pump MntP